MAVEYKRQTVLFIDSDLHPRFFCYGSYPLVTVSVCFGSDNRIGASKIAQGNFVEPAQINESFGET
jgi:hypothetical protein